MTLFKTINPNPEMVLYRLLSLMKVNVTKTTCFKSLQNHPSYPSLFSISDCLANWGVENYSYKIDRSSFNCSDLSFPFIAYFPEAGGRFILINAIENNIVFYSDEHREKIQLPYESFLNRWDGVFLHAKASSISGEIDYQENRILEVIKRLAFPSAVLTILSFLFLCLINQNVNWPIVSLLLSKFFGVSLGILLLIQTVDADNLFFKEICSPDSKYDCNSILASSASKVTSWLSWSEVGFFYFMSTFLMLLLDQNTIPILAGLSVLALPYTIFSLSYQYLHKKWCIICCLVQATLITEGLIFISTQHFNFSVVNFTLSGFLITLIAFLSPILVWMLLKPFFIRANNSRYLKMELNKFKGNSDLFYQILKGQKWHDVYPKLDPIILGNANAQNIVTVISNPLCPPCAKLHIKIEKWLKKENDVKILILFYISHHETEEKLTLLNRIFSLHKEGNTEKVSNALNDWYGGKSKNINEWLKNNPIAVNSDNTQTIENQKEWYENEGFRATPTILVNGFELPGPYNFEDLKYLLT
ncbi:thioredoxin domain-containing protein [Chryseobacterium sp. SL1]|uniref:thioredoxin domain-containing protein n=1 Tax=Chryseobacterium sp. SL1 TaxID=2995159 RepID=UPI002273C422|nr:thioredoxin domain-containing protein [Chryseobacterium sp. SL1]MCY1662560.1 thioredoxin domain-containing protein [Chryseobacterium sp. SL1]